MNVETQAKSGFKTFIITLSISLVVFSAIYFLITDSSGNIDIESDDPMAYNTTQTEEVKGAMTASVFKEIENKPTYAEPAVLQAADTTEDTTTTDTTTTTTTTTTAATTTDTTTEATVPDTGSETLVGTLLALGFFATAVYMIFAGPRKLALAEFEDKITKGL